MIKNLKRLKYGACISKSQAHFLAQRNQEPHGIEDCFLRVGSQLRVFSYDFEELNQLAFSAGQQQETTLASFKKRIYWKDAVQLPGRRKVKNWV